MPDDPGFWIDATKWLLGLLAAVIGVVWTDLKFKVIRLEDKLEGKAEDEEMSKQRINIAELFRGQGQIKEAINVEFREVGRQITNVEKTVISLEGQIGRFASDIESEKRTRSEANRQINQKLDDLMRGVERRLKPRD